MGKVILYMDHSITIAEENKVQTENNHCSDILYILILKSQKAFKVGITNNSDGSLNRVRQHHKLYGIDLKNSFTVNAYSASTIKYLERQILSDYAAHRYNITECDLKKAYPFDSKFSPDGYTEFINIEHLENVLDDIKHKGRLSHLGVKINAGIHLKEVDIQILNEKLVNKKLPYGITNTKPKTNLENDFSQMESSINNFLDLLRDDVDVVKYAKLEIRESSDQTQLAKRFIIYSESRLFLQCLVKTINSVEIIENGCKYFAPLYRVGGTCEETGLYYLTLGECYLTQSKDKFYFSESREYKNRINLLYDGISKLITDIREDYKVVDLSKPFTSSYSQELSTIIKDSIKIKKGEELEFKSKSISKPKKKKHQPDTIEDYFSAVDNFKNIVLENKENITFKVEKIKNDDGELLGLNGKLLFKGYEFFNKLYNGSVKRACVMKSGKGISAYFIYGDYLYDRKTDSGEVKLVSVDMRSPNITSIRIEELYRELILKLNN